jgi:hypothetical protein
MKFFLTLKIPTTNNIFTQKITQAFKKSPKWQNFAQSGHSGREFEASLPF